MRIDLATQSAAQTIQDQHYATWGIDCGLCAEEHYKTLESMANWSYNYRLRPHPAYPQDWAHDVGMEFIPMVAKPMKVPLGQNTWPYCTFLDEYVNSKNRPLCTIDMLSKALTEYNDYWDEVTWMLGINEPYINADGLTPQ